MFKKLASLFDKKLSIKSDKGENTFTMNISGRDGSILYKAENNQINIYWEMSGSVKYGILLAPLDLRKWDEPKGIKISRKNQIEILHKLQAWLKTQKIKSNIDIPLSLEFDDETCNWGGCREPKVKGLAFCMMHYDETLLIENKE